jgi:hypothetical protein
MWIALLESACRQHFLVERVAPVHQCAATMNGFEVVGFDDPYQEVCELPERVMVGQIDQVFRCRIQMGSHRRKVTASFAFKHRLQC